MNPIGWDRTVYERFRFLHWDRLTLVRASGPNVGRFVDVNISRTGHSNLQPEYYCHFTFKEARIPRILVYIKRKPSNSVCDTST